MPVRKAEQIAHADISLSQCAAISDRLERIPCQGFSLCHLIRFNRIDQWLTIRNLEIAFEGAVDLYCTRRVKGVA